MMLPMPSSAWNQSSLSSLFPLWIRKLSECLGSLYMVACAYLTLTKLTSDVSTWSFIIFPATYWLSTVFCAKYFGIILITSYAVVLDFRITLRLLSGGINDLNLAAPVLWSWPNNLKVNNIMILCWDHGFSGPLMINLILFIFLSKASYKYLHEKHINGSMFHGFIDAYFL